VKNELLLYKGTKLLLKVIKAIIIIRQITHQNSAKKSGLRHILFDKSSLQRILSHTKIKPAAHPFAKNIFSIILGCI